MEFCWAEWSMKRSRYAALTSSIHRKAQLKKKNESFYRQIASAAGFFFLLLHLWVPPRTRIGISLDSILDVCLRRFNFDLEYARAMSFPPDRTGKINQSNLVALCIGSLRAFDSIMFNREKKLSALLALFQLHLYWWYSARQLFSSSRISLARAHAAHKMAWCQRRR